VKITGTYTIDAPLAQVWAALNDMEVLARIVPGCERLDQIGENEYEGRIKIGIQAIKGTYNGRIRIEDIQPPHHYKLIASGRSANGVVDGAGTVDLAEQDGKTILTYGGDAQIGGMLASVGQRLIEGASKQMINQSLKALVEQLTLRNSDSAAEKAAEAAPPAETSAAAAENGVAPAAVYAAAAPVAAVAIPVAPPVPPAPEPATFERRSVVVPDHEQLKPESVVRGVMNDMLKERPWLPWVVIAFLLGVVFGRRRH
jgi:carbon monoxide dehydrogenase subunit G